MTNLKTYSPPSVTNPHDDWRNRDENGETICYPEHTDYSPTPRQAVIIEATRAALDELAAAGKYPYNCDVNKIVADIIGVPSDSGLQRATPTLNVEGGVFGYDVYLARKYLEKQALIHANERLINALNWGQGLKLGKIRINAKIAKGAVIKEISRSGASVDFTLGSKKYNATFQSLEVLRASQESANQKSTM